MALGDGFSITQELFDAITTVVPSGGHLLEFGSGVGSTHLAEAGLRITSLEHDQAWIEAAEEVLRTRGKIGRFTIHAPFVGPEESYPFYQAEAVEVALERAPFDAVLIDGPPGDIGRAGVLGWNEELGALDCPIFLDDLNRADDLETAVELARLLHRSFLIGPPVDHPVSGEGVQFGLIENWGDDAPAEGFQTMIEYLYTPRGHI